MASQDEMMLLSQHTGRDIQWGTDELCAERPRVTADAAHRLVDKASRRFCADLIALNNPEAPVDRGPRSAGGSGARMTADRSACR
jgi:hypothetical protein